MKARVEITAADAICLELLVEEGIFVQRIMHQHNNYPNSSSILALIVIPFLALIEHDSVPYLEKKFGLQLPRESFDLARIRHKTKSIDSRYLNYREYSKEAARIIEANRENFRKKGIARMLPSSLVKDVGISYFDGLPIYSTLSVANYLDDKCGLLWNNSKEYCGSVGYSAGSTCALHYCLAEQLIQDRHVFESHEFVVTANDYVYTSLVGDGIKEQTNDECAFFFLSDQLLRLSSIEALRKGGFLENILWIKLATVYLFHAYRAIESFIGFAYQPTPNLFYSRSFLALCSNIFSRAEKKKLKKMKKLRNAFVHYDFEDLIDAALSDSRDFVFLLNSVLESRVEMGLTQYESFLSDLLNNATIALREVTRFPEYNPMHNVFKR